MLSPLVTCCEILTNTDPGKQRRCVGVPADQITISKLIKLVKLGNKLKETELTWKNALMTRTKQEVDSKTGSQEEDRTGRAPECNRKGRGSGQDGTFTWFC